MQRFSPFVHVDHMEVVRSFKPGIDVMLMIAS